MFPSTSSQETSGCRENKTNCFPRDHACSVADSGLEPRETGVGGGGGKGSFVLFALPAFLPSVLTQNNDDSGPLP